MPVVFNNLKEAKEFIKNRFMFAYLDMLDGIENGGLDIVPKHTIKEENDKIIFEIQFERKKLKKRKQLP